jgi:phage terminase large subunit-like protein
MTRKELERQVAIKREIAKRKKANLAVDQYNQFYPWQKEFCAATHDYYESCLCAANQIGKTFTGTTIDSFHLTGDYPEGYEGHIFNFAPLCWGLGYSMEKCRDLLQKALFGDYVGKEFTGGLVPKDKIVSWESATGTPNAMRTVRVRHKSGGTAVIQFWSYTQGQHAIMGDVVDWFHVDEEPRDQTIRPQVLTRTINGDKGKGGRGIYTFTPENGRTELVIKFMDDASDSQFFMQKGWIDAPHITEEKRERMLEQYPAHQRDMRTKGIPMLGHGRIYDLSEEFIKCEPFEIPGHWFVVGGMDFGWDHPQSQVKLIEDRDTETFYLTHCWKASKVSANDAWGAAKPWQQNIPIAWPHDGLQNEKGRDDAVQQKVHYQNAGFRMLSEHATHPPINKAGKSHTGGNSVEHGLYEIRDLMCKGKFKIFSGCLDFFNEFNQYHRDDKGKIVKTMDDILDAVRYAYMMRRYSVRIGDIMAPTKKIYIPKPLKPMGR